MIDHSREAARFVEDRRRAKWHSDALWFVRKNRDKAVKELPEWESLREASREIKEHTIKNLPYYLNQFEKNAKANGIEVLWARDAEEHNRIIEGILHQQGISKVVKSKSMLTEECRLNEYLQKRGYKVIETDLGERIIQLGRDSPSHIVLPAIHLKKDDVAKIFHETLNTDADNSDPQYLTTIARESLRQEFLLAEAAITGVNFALSEEGGIVICTNEGNVDLGVALPKIHIASMGIEKVIPSAKELGVFIRVLARSATGQSITAYTSHIFKPKPNGRLIVIIVDNGRSKLLGGREELLNCIRCGACMNTCPVFRRSGGHSYSVVVPGPIGSAIESSKNPIEMASLSFACTLCGSCDCVCPTKIPLHKILQDNRRDTIKAPKYRGKVKGMKTLFWLLTHPKYYDFVMKIYKKFILKLPKWIIYNRYNSWGRGRAMPEPAKDSFRKMLKRRRRR